MAPNIDEEANNDVDEAPAFIDMNTAVEVPDTTNTNNNDEMMEEDDDAMVDVAEEKTSSSIHSSQQAATAAIVDQSKATFHSHTDAIYAIASHYDVSSGTLSIASGGGDDRAYLHRIATSSVATADGNNEQTTSNNTNTTIPLSHPHTDSISCLSFNTPYITSDLSNQTQQNLLAVGSYDGSIILYDASSGSIHSTLEGPTDVEFVSFHPKGGTVLLAGSIADGTIWMYHAPSKNCMQVFVGHEGGVTAGGFTPDGKWVVSAGQDGTCRVWAPKTGMSKFVFRLMENTGDNNMAGGEVGPGLTCLALGGGNDGQLAICGGEDGKAYVVHVTGKKLVATLSHFEESTSNDGANAANDGMEDDEMGEGEGEARSVEAVGFCPPNVPGTSNWCATGGVDGILKIWNLNVVTAAAAGGGSAQLRQRCVRDDAQKAGITRVKWHTSLPLVICSYTDGAVGIWDVRVGKLVGKLTGHQDMINDMSVEFVNETVLVVTGSDDRTVKMFEFRP